MVRALMLLLAIAGLSSPALAKDWSGHWVARSGGTALFSFDIVTQGETHKATWTRPTHFSLTPAGLSDIDGPVIHIAATKVVESADSLTVSFRKPGGTSDTSFILSVPAAGAPMAELAGLPAGVMFDAFDLSREVDAPTFPDWKGSASYPFTRTYPDNAEMKAMFEADQAARTTDKIDWAKVGPEDAARLKRTRELLDANALNSGADFYYASFIFQHGDEPRDYLLAHLLAMAAMARGYDASWIAAATLDRYLQRIGKSQVFGTQYSKAEKGSWTQAPYDAELIPDSLRKVVGVPDRKSQDDRLKEMK